MIFCQWKHLLYQFPPCHSYKINLPKHERKSKYIYVCNECNKKVNENTNSCIFSFLVFFWDQIKPSASWTVMSIAILHRVTFIVAKYLLLFPYMFHVSINAIIYSIINKTFGDVLLKTIKVTQSRLCNQLRYRIYNSKL